MIKSINKTLKHLFFKKDAMELPKLKNNLRILEMYQYKKPTKLSRFREFCKRLQSRSA